MKIILALALLLIPSISEAAWIKCPNCGGRRWVSRAEMRAAAVNATAASMGLAPTGYGTFAPVANGPLPPAAQFAPAPPVYSTPPAGFRWTLTPTP